MSLFVFFLPVRHQQFKWQLILQWVRPAPRFPTPRVFNLGPSTLGSVAVDNVAIVACYSFPVHTVARYSVAVQCTAY